MHRTGSSSSSSSNPQTRANKSFGAVDLYFRTVYKISSSEQQQQQQQQQPRYHQHQYHGGFSCGPRTDSRVDHDRTDTCSVASGLSASYAPLDSLGVLHGAGGAFYGHSRHRGHSWDSGGHAPGHGAYYCDAAAENSKKVLQLCITYSGISLGGAEGEGGCVDGAGAGGSRGGTSPQRSAFATSTNTTNATNAGAALGTD